MPNRLLLMGTGGTSQDEGPPSGTFAANVGFTDMSEQTVNESATNWTRRVWTIDPRHATTLVTEYRQLILKRRSLSGKVLAFQTNSDGFSGSLGGIYGWDIPGAIGPEWEVLMLASGWQNGVGGLLQVENVAPNGSGLYVPSRANGFNLSGYNTNPRLRTHNKEAGATGVGASLFTDMGVEDALASARARYWVRVRKGPGKRFRGKFWAAGAAEPEAWMHDVTETMANVGDAIVGWVGPYWNNMGNNNFDPLLIEYFSVSDNPSAKPAPGPADPNVLQGGVSSSVDFATASVHATLGFALHRINGNAPTVTMEDRVGSLHGRVLRVNAAAAGPRAMVTWMPGDYIYHGDVLGLIELGAGSTWAGVGVNYPRNPNGSGFYDLAQKSFGMLRDFANAVAWSADHSVNTTQDFSLRQNVTGVAMATPERWWVRHRRDMNAPMMRMWKFGEAEPGTWTVLPAANSEHDPMGRPAFGFDFGAAAGNLYLQHLAWTDDFVSNPINPPA